MVLQSQHISKQWQTATNDAIHVWYCGFHFVVFATLRCTGCTACFYFTFCHGPRYINCRLVKDAINIITLIVKKAPRKERRKEERINIITLIVKEGAKKRKKVMIKFYDCKSSLCLSNLQQQQ